MGTRVSYGITQFYLPPNRGDVLAIPQLKLRLWQQILEVVGLCFADHISVTSGSERKHYSSPKNNRQQNRIGYGGLVREKQNLCQQHQAKIIY